MPLPRFVNANTLGVKTNIGRCVVKSLEVPCVGMGTCSRPARVDRVAGQEARSHVQLVFVLSKAAFHI